MDCHQHARRKMRYGGGPRVRTIGVRASGAVQARSMYGKRGSANREKQLHLCSDTAPGTIYGKGRALKSGRSAA